MGGPPVEVCPSLLGATGWQPKVYNPKTGYLYIPSNEFCMRYAYVADLTYKKGQLFTGVTTEHFSKAEQAGVLRAFDVNQNKVVWEWSNRTPLISHTLSTAGDLVFQGTPEGKVVALNAKNGQELWSFSLGTPQSGGIMSYAVDGKQYLAVAAGGTLRSQVWFGKEPKWRNALKMNWSDLVVVFGLMEREPSRSRSRSSSWRPRASTPRFDGSGYAPIRRTSRSPLATRRSPASRSRSRARWPSSAAPVSACTGFRRPASRSSLASWPWSAPTPRR